MPTKKEYSPVSTNDNNAVDAVPIAELPSRTEERRKKKEKHVSSDAMDIGFTTWMCLSMNGNNGGNELILFLLGVAAASVILTTASQMASAVHRTIQRSDDASIAEVVGCLQNLNTNKETDDQQYNDLYDFVDAVRKQHHTGWFSSTRTSKDFDLREEPFGPKSKEKDARANPTNLITYLNQKGTFAKHTNNGRNLFNETIFKGRGEIVIQKIRKMTSEEQSSLINTIVEKYKSAGCSSSDRSKALFDYLKPKNEVVQTKKIQLIIRFIRDTDKKQRVHQVIMDACHQKTVAIAAVILV